MSLDWYPGIRECCAHWRDAAMLQQTFEALEKAFAEENDACIDCAKSIVEVVCGIIVDELDDPTAPLKPKEANPAFGMWVSTAVRVLKLDRVQNSAFQKLISQHHKLTTSLGDVRNDTGPVSHGKEGFLERLSAHHRRAAVLSADAIVSFLHYAYCEADLNLARTREPYERFTERHVSIDRHASMRLENDDDDQYWLIVSMPGGEKFSLTADPSRILFHLDRTAYLEALRAGQEADTHITDAFEEIENPDLLLVEPVIGAAKEIV